MARTSNVFARVEPEIKDQAEQVLNQLGIPMSNAIGLFLRQVVLQRGIPFEMKLPEKKLPDYNTMTDEQFDAAIMRGMMDISEDKVMSSAQVADMIKREYGV
ncbi:MAG: type II toxin-antitoxin system RelB/DinJ family antitoxin [Clostridia bacterium]|nr:type II toxin-antitoxin system RelB/DinJ family antitoxin [Clostridia bacterium]